MLHNLPRNIPILVDVQLQPLHLIPPLRIHNLVKRAARQRRNHLNHPVRLCRPGKHHLPLRMSQLPQRRGGNIKRHLRPAAQHGRAEVHALHVHQHPRPKPDLHERAVVLAHGDLVVRPARVIRPRRLLHHLLRHRLKVDQIEAFLQHGLRPDALLPRLFLRVVARFHLGHGRHVDGAEVLGFVEVLVERVGRVYRVEFLPCGLVGLHDDGISSGGVGLTSVASFPAYLRMIFDPPGCSGRNCLGPQR